MKPVVQPLKLKKGSILGVSQIGLKVYNFETFIFHIMYF
jgi:hypothetical protein